MMLNGLLISLFIHRGDWANWARIVGTVVLLGLTCGMVWL